MLVGNEACDAMSGRACHCEAASAFQPWAAPSVTTTTWRLVASAGASDNRAERRHAGISAAANVGLRPERRSAISSFAAGCPATLPSIHWGVEAASISRTWSEASRRSSASRAVRWIWSKTGPPPAGGRSRATGRSRK